MKVSTIRELLVLAEETWGDGVVIRYKSGKGTVAERKVIRIFEKTASIFLIFWKH